MHKEVMQFVAAVKERSPEFFSGTRVLEVGSLIINGTIRGYFKDCDYRGIDIAEGYGVDRVCHVTELISTRPYDVVISTEMLEHDSLWRESLKAMYETLKNGGLLVITCAAPNRPEHGTVRVGSPEASPATADHYRNISVEDFASVLPASLFSKSYLGYRGDMDDLYFVGIKRRLEGWEDSQKEIERTIEQRFPVQGPKPLTVTAEVSTKDRYTTTLPMCISAILNQTRKPEKLVIYDDGEQKDLRELPPFSNLLQLADHLGIQWTFYSTERKGQVANHQHCLDNATTTAIWRIDDDEIPEPNCLENLLAEMKEGVGAVAGLIHHPNGVAPLPDDVRGGLEDIARGVNLQWFEFNSGAREVEHLYSSFLFDVAAMKKAGGYPQGLSAIGHREESWATIRLRQAGYSLVVTPRAKTWHLRQNMGGIRSFSDTSLWEHDERLFQEYLKSIGHAAPGSKLYILDSGLGDHLLFRGLLVDEFKRKYPDRKWRLAVCYPEVFNDLDNVEILSIAQAKEIVGDRYEDYSLFVYGWHHGNGRHILDVMREFYAN